MNRKNSWYTFVFGLVAVVWLFSAKVVCAAEYLDTQYGPDGLEVHLLKAKVNKGVLTVSFMVDNPTDKYLGFPAMPVGNVHYTAGSNKYPVLQDVEGKWLASTITYNEKSAFVINALFTTKNQQYDAHQERLSPKGKKVGWMKFEAPADDAWPIELSMPGVSPFTIEKP